MLSDVRTVLASKEGNIRKWARPPSYAVIHDGSFDQQALQTLLSRINAATGVGAVSRSSQVLDLSSRLDSYPTKLRFKLLRAHTGDLVDRVIGLADGRDRYYGEVFIFQMPLRDLTYLAALAEQGRSTRLIRELAEGRNPCFFSLYSRFDRLRHAFIFIDSGLSADDLHSCLYEEVMQTMGVLRDAIGSPYFTFDNTALNQRQENDFDLLRALYDPDIPPGAPVEAVIQAFARLRPDLVQQTVR